MCKKKKNRTVRERQRHHTGDRCCFLYQKPNLLRKIENND